MEYEAALKEVAILKRDAEAVLLGEKRPPPWLVRKEPERWMPMREVRTAPAPVSLAGASSCLERRAFPCLAAWLLLLSSPAPPPPEARPPPSLTVRGPPCRYTSGDACPVLPPVREKESRSVSRDSLFLKCIA